MKRAAVSNEAAALLLCSENEHATGGEVVSTTVTMNEHSLSTHRRSFLFTAAVVAAASLGCTATSKYMRANSAPVAAPPADEATVVFVRPSSFAAAQLITVIDDHGRFVGQSSKKSHFSVTVPAGPHVFIAWAENTAALKADLAPGKTYFVEVAPKLGGFSARAHLLALTPKSESWSKLPEWLAETAGYTPDPLAGQAFLDGRKEDTTERVRRGIDALAKYSPEELAERVIRPEDGK